MRQKVVPNEDFGNTKTSIMTDLSYDTGLVCDKTFEYSACSYELLQNVLNVAITHQLSKQLYTLLLSPLVKNYLYTFVIK